MCEWVGKTDKEEKLSPDFGNWERLQTQQRSTADVCCQIAAVSSLNLRLSLTRVLFIKESPFWNKEAASSETSLKLMFPSCLLLLLSVGVFSLLCVPIPYPVILYRVSLLGVNVPSALHSFIVQIQASQGL